MDLSQSLALGIFVLLFAAIIIGKVHRYIPALIAAGLTLGVVFLLVMREPLVAANILNLGQLAQPSFWIPGQQRVASHGVNWQTIIFIGGMMAMVESMGQAGFFEWLCLSVARLVKYRPVPVFIGFMLVSGILSMFIASITVMLFMTAIGIELSRLLKIDPVPLIIGMVFASNTGGSATLAGDPPNIIIGTSLGFTFTDFLVNTGPIAGIGLLGAVGFFYLACRKSLVGRSRQAAVTGPFPQPHQAITNPARFKINAGIFALAVALLLTHAATGLSIALIGVIAAVLTLAAARRRALHIIRRLDWRTLLFFIGLFITVGGLEETGVLQRLAEYIGHVSGGRVGLVLPIILWLSASASALVDNIPFAAAMVPVIMGISHSTSIPVPPLAWSLALGTDIGGNATPIGASANVVSTAIAERRGFRISWARYLKYAVPATILVVAMCWTYLTLRYG
jgi:Na+/H+ antiporter NhaD/arsenite permease-like protein